MDEFLQALQTLRENANTMLAGLPPLEQFEAAPEIAYGFRVLTQYANTMKDMAANLQAKVSASIDKVKGDALVTAEATVKEKLITEGVVILKVDADAAVLAARSQAATETRTQITAEAEAKAKIGERRAKLVSDKKLPQVAAEKIPDEVLGRDDHETAVAAIVGRVAKLNKLGLTGGDADPIIAEMAGIATDEAGEAEFARRFGTIEASAKVFNKGPSANPLEVPGGGVPVEPDTAKARRFF